MCLAIWAASHIKEAIMGEVEPRLKKLVKDGPYQFIRHPVYLGITIALFGSTFELKSWVGMIGTFVLFLPSEIYRARLEEKALQSKFGKEWEEYALRTGFLLPLRIQETLQTFL